MTEKKALNEIEICQNYISPAIERAGWDKHTQIRREFCFTAGRVIVRGKVFAKRKAEEDGRSFEPPPRWGYHSFRRKFATELKGAPDKDVADLGGWKDLNTLREIYQMADHDTMVAALTSRMEVRNRKAQG